MRMSFKVRVLFKDGSYRHFTFLWNLLLIIDMYRKSGSIFFSVLGWLLLIGIQSEGLQNLDVQANHGAKSENPELNIQRPNYLDLCGPKLKPGYYFNSTIGSLLQLDMWELALRKQNQRRRPSQWSFSAWPKTQNNYHKLLPPPSKFKQKYSKKM